MIDLRDVPAEQMTNLFEPSSKLGTSTLARLLEISRRLSVTANLDGILCLIIDAMRDVLDAERATVFEFDSEREELFATVAHGLNDGASGDSGPESRASGEVRFPAHLGIAGEAAQSRQTVMVADAYADSRFNRDVDRQTGFRTRSILSIPLLSFDDELIGVAQVLNKRAGVFSKSDQVVAEALAAQAAVAIKRARLVEDRIARLRMEHDLTIARQIQQQTIPRRIPTIEGFDIALWGRSADETAGDAHDVITLPGTRATLFMLADATGHGIGPALQSTSIRAMLRMAVRLEADLEKIVTHLNEQICEDVPGGRFITCWLGVLDADTGTLTSFSAGQAPLLHLRAGPDALHVEGHSADFMPFGIVPLDDAAEVQTFELQPGDVFLVASDGIFEAVDPEDQMFTDDRVIDSLRRNAHLPARELLDSLVREVEAFAKGRPPQDDQTVIVLKRHV